MNVNNMLYCLFTIAICLVNQDCSSNSETKIIGKAIEVNGRSSILFDDNWKFFRGNPESAESADFDDSSWRVLNLPHDWSIEDISGTNSPLDSNAIGGIHTGYFVGGTGWYRKMFSIPSNLCNKELVLQFDGIYQNAEIWLNDRPICYHPYGYTSFRINITDFIVKGKVNILAVKVSNEGRNSRWYSGSGIYRHVWLEVTNPVHIDPWQIAITSPIVDVSKAKVCINTRVYNESEESSEIILKTRVLDQEGSEIIQSKLSKNIEPGNNFEFVNSFDILNPTLWSLEKPTLYTAINEVYSITKDGKLNMEDRIQTNFGIRGLEFNVVEGFKLNGKPILLKGACMHHDNGPLGAASYNRAEERRVELMKANGFNAIRCSHNPPSTAFLDACDRLGILVIDEAFDMWREPKNPDDYHLYFNDWWQNDIENMIRRDRNHPSIILWSIGNEIPERKRPEGTEIAKLLHNFIRQLDSSRLITAAVNSVNSDLDDFFSNLDICGYNYAISNYLSDHKRFPDRIILSTESFPLESFKYWMAVLDYPWVIGDFVWTGYDYLGEASIGWRGHPHEGSFYPWNHAYCGDLDICGFKRPQSYYRDILWKNGNQISLFVISPTPSFPVNHNKEKWSKWNWQDVIGHWNWPEYKGKVLKVEVYSSCEEIER